jgi:class 3 adenylate cyclase
VLATVLFTDIVGSTEKAAALGDRRWRDLLDHDHTTIRRAFSRFRGHEIKTTGDGVLATFDGPARGVRCACAIADEINSPTRAGRSDRGAETDGRQAPGKDIDMRAETCRPAPAHDRKELGVRVSPEERLARDS